MGRFTTGGFDAPLAIASGYSIIGLLQRRVRLVQMLVSMQGADDPAFVGIVDFLEQFWVIFFESFFQSLAGFDGDARGFTRRDGKPQRQRQVVYVNVNIRVEHFAILFSHIQYIHHAAISESDVGENDCHRPVFADFGLHFFIAEAVCQRANPFAGGAVEVFDRKR
jgi:hypothetical protein